MNGSVRRTGPELTPTTFALILFLILAAGILLLAALGM